MGIVLNIHIVRRGSNNQVYAMWTNSTGGQDVFLEEDDLIARIKYFRFRRFQGHSSREDYTLYRPFAKA